MKGDNQFDKLIGHHVVSVDKEGHIETTFGSQALMDLGSEDQMVMLFTGAYNPTENTMNALVGGEVIEITHDGYVKIRKLDGKIYKAYFSGL